MSNVSNVTVVGFLSVALFLAADYSGGVDMLDAMIDYVRAATAVLEGSVSE